MIGVKIQLPDLAALTMPTRRVGATIVMALLSD
jgi:hypothetical protein